MTLVDTRGEPLYSQKTYARPITAKVDKEVGVWAGQNYYFSTLPGGGVLQFDLDKLTLRDFRQMRQHYQLGASINILSFVMHQIEWKVDCEQQEIADLIEDELRANWTRLILGLSQSFWAGYSPIAVNYENRDGYVRLKKLKDIVPEQCDINWKKVKGWAPPGKARPSINIYDGFYQSGNLIPVENSLWYPLLMENGNHWGRKILKPAFPSWFFSNLIHLFANRYFERFGEPLPVGRAPMDDDFQKADGSYVQARTAMETLVSQIRSRAVTVLPSDRDPESGEYEYDIDYLESQMRGADFERYLSRLDEEMSLSVFTPVLLFRTADVGSYNLGQAHLRIFEQMLNAIAGDIQNYIQNYLVERIRKLNFGENSPVATWSYRRLGTTDLSVYKEIVVELIRQGAADVDTEELGAIMGVDIDAVKTLTGDDPDDELEERRKAKVTAAKQPLNEAIVRSVREVIKGGSGITFGFRNKFIEAMVKDGFSREYADTAAHGIYEQANTVLDNLVGTSIPEDRMREIMQRAVFEKLP